LTCKKLCELRIAISNVIKGVSNAFATPYSFYTKKLHKGGLIVVPLFKVMSFHVKMEFLFMISPYFDVGLERQNPVFPSPSTDSMKNY
jgi:hypothetical protein